MNEQVTRISRAAAILAAALLAGGTLQAQTAPALVPIAEAGRSMPVLQRSVRVRAEQTPLRDALRAVAVSADIDFVWDASIAEIACTVSLQTNSIAVAQAVTELLDRCAPASAAIEAVVSPAATLVLRRRLPVLEDTSATGTLEGSISDAETGSPVAGAYVDLESESRSTSSDDAGRFVFSFVRAGAHTLRVRRMGREPLRISSVVVTAGATLRLALFVRVFPILLANVVISPSSFAALDAGPTPPSINREQLGMMPQLAEDALRAATRFPGVTMNDFTARLQAIGGTGDDVLITLDGVELAEPYHLRAFGDVVSIVDVRAIQEMQLSTGGFGAQHGDRIAGVLAMRSIAAEPGPLRGDVTASALDASARAMAGIGTHGAWFAAARYGYPEKVLYRSGVEGHLRSRYANAFAKMVLGSARDTLAVHALAAVDHFAFDPIEDPIQRGANDHVYLWTTGRLGLGRRGELRQILSFARSGSVRNESALNISDSIPFLSLFFPAVRVNDVRETRVASAREDWRFEWSPRWVTSAGIALRSAATDFDYDLRRDSSGVLSGRRVLTTVSARALSGYAAVRVSPHPATILEIGDRFDRQERTNESIMSPRLLFAYSIDSRTTMRFAIGRYAQFQRPYELAIADTLLALDRADRAVESGLELEQGYPHGLRARIGAYARNYDRVRPRYVGLVPASMSLFEADPYALVRLAPDRRVARRLGLTVEMPQARPFAWRAAYSWSRASDRIGGTTYPAPFDQRHGAHVDGTLKHRWGQLGGTWQFHSGWPMTLQTFALNIDADTSLRLTRIIGPHNGWRLGAYQRLDVRAQRTWQLRTDRAQFTLFGDVLNVFDKQNPGFLFAATASVLDVPIEREEITLPMMRRVANVGVRWNF